MLQLYPKEKIIFNEVEIADFYVTRHGYIKKFDTKHITYSQRKRIRYANEYAKKYLSGCHVIEFPSYVLADEKNKWGVSRLHFAQVYYDYALEAVNIIAEGNSKAEEELKLLQLKNQYSRLMHDKYFENFHETLSLLDGLKDGLKKYE